MARLIRAARPHRGECVDRLQRLTTLERHDVRAHERLRLKQAEWHAKHEGERIDAEPKVLMGSAAELAGVAIFASSLTTDFDEAAFARDHKALYETYHVTKPCRQFKIRW